MLSEDSLYTTGAPFLTTVHVQAAALVHPHGWHHRHLQGFLLLETWKCSPVHQHPSPHRLLSVPVSLTLLGPRVSGVTQCVSFGTG